MQSVERVQAILDDEVEKARADDGGAPADYIPELAQVPLEPTSAAITLCSGEVITAGDATTHRMTYQSSAKLLLLAGLLEELGPDEVFRVVGKEPSGGGFSSIAALETKSPVPSNPLINSGAIALSGLVPGTISDRVKWVLAWAEKLYGKRLPIDHAVLLSERATGDRNRSIAYLLKNQGILTGRVDETLEVYFSLCSIEGTAAEASRFGAILAGAGRCPTTGHTVLSRETASTVVSLMATCGMYDESGGYLAATGLPAKSGVSGIIVAVAPGRAGIAVASPRLNPKGGSVRGHAILRGLSRALKWHFALPEPVHAPT